MRCACSIACCHGRKSGSSARRATTASSDHPLRTRSGLLASAAIEYAAQAAALHGALHARAAGGEAAPGFLASARDVRLAVFRLDDLPRDPDGPERDELRVVAVRQAGDAGRLLYAFSVRHDRRELASGRLAVVLQPRSAAAAP